jgi:hypothetical protein
MQEPSHHILSNLRKIYNAAKGDGVVEHIYLSPLMYTVLVSLVTPNLKDGDTLDVDKVKFMNAKVHSDAELQSWNVKLTGDTNKDA